MSYGVTFSASSTELVDGETVQLFLGTSKADTRPILLRWRGLHGGHE